MSCSWQIFSLLMKAELYIYNKYQWNTSFNSMKQAWGAMAWIRKKDDEDGEERMNPGGRIYICRTWPRGEGEQEVPPRSLDQTLNARLCSCWLGQRGHRRHTGRTAENGCSNRVSFSFVLFVFIFIFSSFIEIYLTYNIVYTFKVYSVLIWCIYKLQNGHQHSIS